MILGGHLGGNTGLREMGTQGWPGFVSFGFVNNIETCRFLSHFNFLSMSKGLMRFFLFNAGSGVRLPAQH